MDLQLNYYIKKNNFKNNNKNQKILQARKNGDEYVILFKKIIQIIEKCVIIELRIIFTIQNFLIIELEKET